MTRIGGVGNQVSYTGGKTPQAQAADDADRDTRLRMQQLDQMAHEYEAQTQERIEESHRQLDIQQNKEQARHEAAIEDQRANFYAQSRDLQQQFQAEITRIRREGEAELRRLNDYYRGATTVIERDGNEKLTDLLKRNEIELKFNREQGAHELITLQDQHAEQVRRFQGQREHQATALTESARQQNERMKEAYQQASERSRDQYVEQHGQLVKAQNDSLDKLYRNANTKLTGIREESAAKLDAYSTRQNDPFYQMMTTDARFSDQGDHYVLEATIPTHERDHVSVSVKGNQIVLSGYRRNEERLQIEPGRSQGSAAFQSFQETFPITWPVESRQITRDYDGDRLVVKIPKKNEFAAPLLKEKRPVAAAVAERPNFPANIPYVERRPAGGREVLEPREPIRADLKTPGALVLDNDVKIDALTPMAKPKK
jgi:HSP20 family molecular chaperone IbpA